MRAMLLRRQAPIEEAPLEAARVTDPRPAADEVLVRVSACGVCRTDLHIVEGDLPVPTLPVVPGHEIVGRVAEAGADVASLAVGDRVGVGWVNRLCGVCDPCTRGAENLCLSPTFSGYHRHGGYAETAVVPAAFAHRLPDALPDDVSVAPLLCAGIIGYRALKRSGLQPGGRVALFGFGGSAHIALQIAVAWGCEVYVFSRRQAARARALAMGADWAGPAGERPPREYDHAVSFAPAGSVIPHALAGLAAGGTLALAGVYVDGVPSLDYRRHLFRERHLVSVTANTRQDARELLQLAARLPIRPDVEVFPLESANEALGHLKSGRLGGQAAVLTVDASDSSGGALG
jgi:propanol-preferring alcohol dehydrogenase